MNLTIRKTTGDINLPNNALSTLTRDELQQRLNGTSPSSDEQPPELSPAARRAARIAAVAIAPPREVIKQVDIDGEAEPFYIRLFDPVILTRYHLHVSRTADGRLDLSDDDKTHSWLATLLWCGVVRGEGDTRPYFHLRPDPRDPMGSAWEWAGSTDAVIKKCAGILQHQIILHNLDFFNPDAHAEAEAAYAAAGLKPEPHPKKELKEPSTIPGATPPTDGSTTIASMPPAPPSPSNSTAATGPSDIESATSG